MTRAPLLSTLFFTVTASAGCVARNLGDDGDTTSSDTSTGSGASTGTIAEPTSSGVTPTSGESTGTSTSATTTASPQSTGTTGELPFIVDPDGGAPTCDLFAQDCPEGQKCAAWASDGGNAWNATRCVLLTGDQLPGEPCTTAGGGVSGEDDCIKGAMCWDVGLDNVGFCVALCSDGECTTATCDPGFVCAVTAECAIPICLPSCDPLLQDCPGDDVCLPSHDNFLCVLDASGDEGQVFDPCEFANACDPGLVCAAPTSASECDPQSTGCCQPMCSLSAMAPCPGAGQQCLSLHEEGQAPPAFEDIGFCTLPP